MASWSFQIFRERRPRTSPPRGRAPPPRSRSRSPAARSRRRWTPGAGARARETRHRVKRRARGRAGRRSSRARRRRENPRRRRRAHPRATATAARSTRRRVSCPPSPRARPPRARSSRPSAVRTRGGVGFATRVSRVERRDGRGVGRHGLLRELPRKKRLRFERRRDLRLNERPRGPRRWRRTRGGARRTACAAAFASEPPTALVNPPSHWGARASPVGAARAGCSRDGRGGEREDTEGRARGAREVARCPSTSRGGHHATRVRRTVPGNAARS